MKRLLVIPFLFSILACGPAVEKIKDRTGGCANGKCTTDESTKPQACNSGSNKISSFKGYTFATAEERSNGVSYRAEIQFANTNAAFTQYCEKNQEYASPTIISNFSTNQKGDRLRFHEPSVKEEKFGNEKCKAEITADNFKVSYQGMCLVLEDASGSKTYFERKMN